MNLVTTKTKLLSVVMVAIFIATFSFGTRHVATAAELGIGSPAPPLDIQFWVQDGSGKFKHIKKFEKGKVYVVEFWATWCAPCIASMPHLAELQTKYQDRDVQIISVSDETLDEVKALLGQQNEEVGKSFDEITSAYCLTADPDGSVHTDYLGGANIQAIPTAFIVGKTGLIEWIGSPFELDGPLEAVVTDQWDRERYKQEREIQENFQKNMEQVAMLAGAKRYEDAIKLAETQIKEAKMEALRNHWTAVRNSLKLTAGMLDDEVLNFYREQIELMKSDPESIRRFAYSLYGQMQDGVDVGPLADEAIKAINEVVEKADANMKPLLHNTAALIYEAKGDLEAAIKAQQAAIDSTDNPTQKSKLKPFLDLLKKKLAGEDAEEPKAE